MTNGAVDKMLKVLESSDGLTKRQKEDMIKLLADLKKELALIPENDKDDAASIVNFAAAGTHEAVKSKRNSILSDLSLKGLSESVRKYEASHPDLFAAVNAVCDYLAGIGI